MYVPVKGESMERYELYADKKECCGCGACRDMCHVGAIYMSLDEEGFFYPQIDREKCTDCGLCRQVCPIKGRAGKECDRLYFGAQAKNRKLRYSSSSGGIFPVLAEYIFGRQGIVYGAAFNENMEVVHREAYDMAQLGEIQKTKYVQSSLDEIYRRIEGQLDGGRWVLFCGTPCQAHALRLFLGRYYSRLIIVDLVCYGVPSPGIWKKYVKYLELRHHGKMTEFYFRDKRNRDNGHTCSYVIDGKEYVEPIYRDAYCRMYFRNYILRPSCHSCKFCHVERDSDFTIGDFWGIENIRPKMDDGMGTSLVIVHTGKGREIWDAVKDETVWFKCKKADILQPHLQSPARIAGRQKLFTALYRVMPFSLLMRLVNSRLYNLLQE